jgi:hypothetical protein
MQRRDTESRGNRGSGEYEAPALVDTEALARPRAAGCGLCITGGGAVTAEEFAERELEGSPAPAQTASSSRD